MLCAASMLDQPFEPEPLADLLGVDPAELTEELERLCERRILRVDGLGFRFRYELVRRVLRESISPARRRLLLQRLDALGQSTEIAAARSWGLPRMTHAGADDAMAGPTFASSAEPAYVMDPDTDRILAANDAGCSAARLHARRAARDRRSRASTPPSSPS